MSFERVTDRTLCSLIRTWARFNPSGWEALSNVDVAKTLKARYGLEHIEVWVIAEHIQYCRISGEH